MRRLLAGLGLRRLIVVAFLTTLSTLGAVAILSAPVAWAEESDGLAHPASDEHPAAEHGAGHEGAGHEGGEHAPQIDAKKLGLQLLNFGILLFILVKFGGAAINKSLAARHHQLKADLAAAAALRAAAEAKLVKQEQRLASLEQEIADMRRGIKAEAESEKARLIAAAEERAKRIKAETSFLIEQQVRDAEVRLRRESADAALKIAEDILRRSMSAADQERLLTTFVGDVERDSPATGKAAG
ncbi:MAG: ATP synthase F0 subunit B [Haliangium ochraceum]